MGRSTEVAALTSEQIASFERDGFLILNDPCRQALIDELVDEFEVRFNEGFHPGPSTTRDGVIYAMHELRGDYHWQRIMNAWTISRRARELALAPAVLSALEGLYGRAPQPFQTLNFPVGT